MKNKVTETKIEKLIPDNLNANKGTEYGERLIEKSFRQFGAGRSILIDKNGRIIAGNKAVENAGAIGIEDVIVIESDGTKLIAVKRTDIDLDSMEGRELAIADNATAKANISWDQENIEKIKAQWNDLKPKDWGVPEASEGNKPPEPPEKKVISTRLIVECNNVITLQALFSELQDRGFHCELKE